MHASSSCLSQFFFRGPCVFDLQRSVCARSVASERKKQTTQNFIAPETAEGKHFCCRRWERERKNIWENFTLQLRCLSAITAPVGQCLSLSTFLPSFLFFRPRLVNFSPSICYCQENLKTKKVTHKNVRYSASRFYYTYNRNRLQQCTSQRCPTLWSLNTGSLIQLSSHETFGQG